MRSAVRRVATAPFRLLPSGMRRRLVQAALHAAASQTPKDALRELLTIDSDVSGLIDQTALAYGDGVHVKHRLMRYHDFFVERLAPGERVLDIGCGYGAVAFSMASRADAQVTGIEMDARNVAEAARLFPHANLRVIHGEAPQDIPSEHFDTVVMSNVLEHIDRRVAFLRDVQQRVAARRWLIRVPMFNRDWRPSLRQELGLFAYSDPTHYTEYTRDSFEAEMREAGFAIAHLQVNWGEIWAAVEPQRS